MRREGGVCIGSYVFGAMIIQCHDVPKTIAKFCWIQNLKLCINTYSSVGLTENTDFKVNGKGAWYNHIN